MTTERRRTVLVADENASVREALAKFLGLRGFDVATAATVDEALDAILLHRPAAAIVELRLAGGSGRDVVVSMPARVPVVMFTSSPNESSELQRLRPRTRLVTKPYSLLLLIEIVEDMLNRAESFP